MTKLDVLGIAAHPDDVELSCGGTICKLVNQGYSVGIADLTMGQLGSRGTPEIRVKEADSAAQILGIKVRENLGMEDGNLANTKPNQEKIIRLLRRYQPDILLINAPEDRHPDHPAAAQLVCSALFYSGLKKIETTEPDGSPQSPWRPSHVLHYMQTLRFEPTLVVDVSDTWEQRTQALLAFESQFHNPEYTAGEGEPVTFISNPEFLQFIEARAKTLGYRIGATHGEGFLYYQGPFGVDDLVSTFMKQRRA